jgi:hypothetical protein
LPLECDHRRAHVNSSHGTRELEALLFSLDGIGPKQLTSCPGWTSHHLTAHVAGNYEEVLAHVEAFVDHRPLERTRSWEEREQPFRLLDFSTLLSRIEELATVTKRVVGDVLVSQPDAELTWTGRTVRVSGFMTHMRSEDALHRWDLVGDDEMSFELLGQQILLEHAVTFIGKPLLQRGLRLGAMPAFVARVRSTGQDDLIVETLNGISAKLSTGPVQGDATIEGDAAARLLLLWGRKPTPFVRLRTLDDGVAALHVQNLLCGY